MSVPDWTTVAHYGPLWPNMDHCGPIGGPYWANIDPHTFVCNIDHHGAWIMDHMNNEQQIWKHFD